MHGAALDRGRARRHADHDARTGEEPALEHPPDEMLDHLLRGGEVGDHAVAQRLNRLDLGRGASEHRLGLVANGNDTALAVPLLSDSDNGRLVEHDPPSRHVNQCVRRAKVDGHVRRDKAQDPRKHTPAPIWLPATSHLRHSSDRQSATSL